MSRKDYEKVAAIINRLSRKPGMPAIHVAWLIAEFVEMFEADNKAFISSRFIDACLKQEHTVHVWTWNDTGDGKVCRECGAVLEEVND